MAREREPQTIKCPRCGAQVYRRAVRCPHCDSSLLLDNEARTRFISMSVALPPRRGGLPWAILIAALVVLALLAGVGVWYFAERPAPTTPKPAQVRQKPTSPSPDARRTR